MPFKTSEWMTLERTFSLVQMSSMYNGQETNAVAMKFLLNYDLCVA